MEKSYTTSFLFQYVGASPSLVSVETPLRPGVAFIPKGFESIVVSGGFPRLSPETPFHLSPTLQLNSDLTTLGESDLKSLANAELERNIRQNFRSYIVDADNRVCVLANDPQQLAQFQDTYEGVLEIEPLLLNGSHPDYPTITDISIQQRKELQICYGVRSPINRALCTYCGNCGTVCPDNCLDEQLFLDFTKCSYCKECEKACPVDAVDLHGVEERGMNIPAIILLDGAKIDTEGDRQGIYEESQLPALFKSISSYVVDEIVSHDKRYCHYSSRLGYGCSKCVDSCGFKAILQGESGVEIDPQQCRECGNCVSACPTGAIQYERFDDRAFIEYFRTIPSFEGKSVVVGNEEELHKLWWQHKGERYEHQFFLEYPEVEALSLLHFFFLFARGASRITILSRDGGSEKLLQQVKLVNRLLASLFSFDDFVAVSKTPILPKYLHMQHHHPLQKFYGDLSFSNRRTKLASILQFLTRASGSVVPVQNNDLDGFGYLECDGDRCTHCLACLNECAIGALGADENQMTLTYDAGVCVTCGICTTLCPESALRMTKDFVMDNDYYQAKILTRADPAACKGCGKVFGTRKSLEKVMQVLGDVDYLEYCDSCKVANIFEAETI